MHSDWDWGKERSGVWTGMIGRVVNGSADLALGGLSADSKRQKTSPLNYIGEALRDISKINTAMELMVTNTSRLTYICPRLLINGRAANFGHQYFNLPPKRSETTFLMEQLTIAVPKNFALKNQ
ncbi:unnamed protein product [Medioppia subpectinata]|uniref:Uncharacterized protein n=1 Tax=Medioppia subpectinata TaxID=1979941 RepID=A0A7R9PT33_9ACAR|nr:unnamed protein product [Medioppia subpectinata]CAG2100245.1 unnamed protein product [Medioppia subpectinata]